jgi:hypothetical protein
VSGTREKAMARLTDPEMLARYKGALSEWKVKGAIELEKDAPEGLRTTLEGVTVESFKEALYHFVCQENGEIDQVKETRNWEPCNRWEYHYDLRPTINGVKVYVETRLYPESFSSREEPEIHIVHIKPA